MELIELLKQGRVEEFNAARARQSSLNFFAEDLADIKAMEADLSSANMEKADLTDADLTDAVLARGNLNGADLCNTKMSGILGLKLKMREAYAEGVDLRMADLSGGDLSDSEFTGADLGQAVAVNAKLKRTAFTDTQLVEADFTEARLSSATFVRCNLSKVTLADAILVETSFAESVLAGADLSRAKLHKAQLQGVDLSGAKLHGADLSGADLTGALVDGADFSRADLSDAVLDGVDLSTGTFHEAEVPVAYAPKGTSEPAPAAADHVIEDAMVAVRANSVMVMWENPAEADGKPRFRVAVASLAARKTPRKISALPVPAELVGARAVAPHGDGFLIMLLLHRPGGYVVYLFDVGVDGTVGTRRTLRMPYTPVVRPILLHHDGKTWLYGISQEGPAVQVHAVTAEGLEPHFARQYTRARGFASDHTPVVLSKGGVLELLGPTGLGQPASIPKGFPGTARGVCRMGDGLGVAWATKTEKGLRYTEIGSRHSFEPLVLVPKEVVGAIDLNSVGDEGWAVFTRVPDSFANTTAWVARFPAATMLQVSDPEDFDVSEVAIHDAAGKVVVTLISSDGRFEVHTVSGSKVRRRWGIG